MSAVTAFSLTQKEPILYSRTQGVGPSLIGWTPRAASPQPRRSPSYSESLRWALAVLTSAVLFPYMCGRGAQLVRGWPCSEDSLPTCKAPVHLRNAIVNTVREPLVVLDQDLRVVAASRSFYRTFKANPERYRRQAAVRVGRRRVGYSKAAVAAGKSLAGGTARSSRRCDRGL